MMDGWRLLRNPKWKTTVIMTWLESMQTHLDNSFFPSGLACTSVHFTLTISVPNEGLASKEHVQNVAGFKSKLLTTICDLILFSRRICLNHIFAATNLRVVYIHVCRRKNFNSDVSAHYFVGTPRNCINQLLIRAYCIVVFICVCYNYSKDWLVGWLWVGGCCAIPHANPCQISHKLTPTTLQL